MKIFHQVHAYKYAQTKVMLIIQIKLVYIHLVEFLLVQVHTMQIEFLKVVFNCALMVVMLKILPNIVKQLVQALNLLMK